MQALSLKNNGINDDDCLTLATDLLAASANGTLHVLVLDCNLVTSEGNFPFLLFGAQFPS